MAIVVPEPTSFEQFLHIGLFIGAIFQIVCIMAVVFVPETKTEKEEEQFNQTPVHTKHGADQSRRGKREKKKYR